MFNRAELLKVIFQRLPVHLKWTIRMLMIIHCNLLYFYRWHNLELHQLFTDEHMTRMVHRIKIMQLQSVLNDFISIAN